MRLRFYIRDLLWLTLVAALIIGWWVDHRELTKERSRELGIFNLKYADVKIVSGTLQHMFAENADVEISADGWLNAIVASAPSRQQAEIEAILSQLDAPPK